MEKTVRDRLLVALDELTGRSLKSFRNKLNDCEIKEGFEKIPKGKLENADTEDLTDLILRYYKKTYGVELTVNVLKAINENTVAAQLEDSPKTGSSASASSSSPRKHFVDENVEALISGVPLVAPILDSLLAAELLNYEEYDTIMKEGTSFAQMRMLCNKYVRSWKDPQKDIFKKTLKKHNPVLVANLERSKP